MCGEQSSAGMAIDPVCGMLVAQDKATSTDRGGQTYYFCAESCRDEFLSRTK